MHTQVEVTADSSRVREQKNGGMATFDDGSTTGACLPELIGAECARAHRKHKLPDFLAILRPCPHAHRFSISDKKQYVN
jgi:hypothetical protein